jgi:hypothetical protein
MEEHELIEKVGKPEPWYAHIFRWLLRGHVRRWKRNS